MGNLHLGTIGWSYNFWKGNFYPKKQPTNKLLAYYASQFSSVEVDSTFYRVPSSQTVIQWKLQTPKGFLFSLKFPKVITHVKMLRNCQNETGFFLDTARLLQEKLGPLLLQFPPSFGIDRLPDLTDFLNKLPKSYRYVIEFRNKGMLNQALYSLLRKNKVALAWTDGSIMSLITEVTADFLYVRWEGDRKKVKGTLGQIEVNRQNDLAVWAEKIKLFVQESLDIFGYFGKYYSGFPPSDLYLLQSYLGVRLLPNL